jgi:hypothetical protein
MSPVTLDVPAGPVLAELTEAIDGATLLRIRFGDVLVLVLPAELAEDLVDAVIEAQADQAAAFIPARPG